MDLKYNLAVYFIGGGPMNSYTIKWAKKFNLKIIVSDKNIKAPCLKIADEKLIADARDYKVHLNFIKKIKNKYKIVGTICQIEDALITQYMINKYCKIKSFSLNNLKNCSNKKKHKIKLIENNIDVPKTLNLRNYKNAKHEKIILKPIDGSGSRGVYILNKDIPKQKIKLMIKEIKKKFSNYVIEEYIPGRSIDGNAVIIDGKFYFAGIFEKFISPEPHRLPLGGQVPVNIGKKLFYQFKKKFKKTCNALNINNGVVKIDTILFNKKFYILETATRLHGDVGTVNLQHFSSGINVFNFLFNYWKNKKINTSYLELKIKKHGFWNVLMVPPNFRLKKINSIPKVFTKIWINKKFNLNKRSYNNTSQIPGYVCCVTKKKSDIIKYSKILYNEIYYGRKNEAKRKSNSWYKGLNKYFKDNNIDPKINVYFS
jgi:hypothetical protein